MKRHHYPPANGSVQDLYFAYIEASGLRIECTKRRAFYLSLLDAYPAQALRIEQRKPPRDWHSRWLAAGCALYAGRMIALKTDPIWAHPKLNRFGTPWPPFDFKPGWALKTSIATKRRHSG